MKQVALFIVLFIALTGCANDKAKLDVSGLKQSFANNEPIEIKKYAPFEWDTVYFFEPYATDSDIKTETGTAVPFPGSNSEGRCLVVFVSHGKVVSSLEVSRGDIDFCGLRRKGGYHPEDAKFTVGKNTSGSKCLKEK